MTNMATAGITIISDNSVYLYDNCTTSAMDIVSQSNTTKISEPDDTPYQSLIAVNELILGILTLLLIPVILGGNGLVLFVLYRFQYLRTKTNIYIGFLSFADAMLAVITLPMYFGFYLYHDSLMHYKNLCILKFSSVMCLLTASLITLLAVAVDRYIAILHPIKYRMSISKDTSKKIVLVIWIYSLVVGALPFFFNSIDSSTRRCEFYDVLPKALTIPVVTCAIFICLSISCGIYVKLFITISKMRRVSAVTNLRKSRLLQDETRKEKKSVMTMALVLFVFFLFWIPLLVSSFLKTTDLKTEVLVDIFKNYTVLLTQSNSAVNPFIYSFMKTDISRMSRAVLPTCFGRKKKLFIRRSPGVQLETNEVKIQTESTKDDIEMEQLE